MARSTENASLEREIGQRIMLLRGDETQEALAESIGVSREIIQHWERGTRHIKAGHLAALAQHFGCSVDYLLGLVPDKSPELDIRGATKLTGLSEGAIDFLMSLNTEGRYYQDQRKVLSLLLETLIDERQEQSHDVISFGDVLAFLSECRKAAGVSATPSWDDSVFQKERELKRLGRYSMGPKEFANAIIECEVVDRFRKLARFVVFGRDE